MSSSSSSIPHIHCLKCKTKTTNVTPTGHVTQKGGAMVKANCGTCGRKKCMIVKKGAGWWDPTSW